MTYVVGEDPLRYGYWCLCLDWRSPAPAPIYLSKIAYPHLSVGDVVTIEVRLGVGTAEPCNRSLPHDR